MTNNQIEYWKLQETRRSNQAKEAETHRHNTVSEQLSGGELGESVRHNRAVEQETARHNAAMDSYDLLNLAEGVRTHQANESISWGNIGLGYANLGETNRANTTRESLENAKQRWARTIEGETLKVQERQYEKQNAINEAKNSIDMVKAVFQGIGTFISPMTPTP